MPKLCLWVRVFNACRSKSITCSDWLLWVTFKKSCEQPHEKLNSSKKSLWFVMWTCPLFHCLSFSIYLFLAQAILNNSLEAALSIWYESACVFKPSRCGFWLPPTPPKKGICCLFSLPSLIFNMGGLGFAVPQLWGFRRASRSLGEAKYRGSFQCGCKTPPDLTRLDPSATSAAISTFQQETGCVALA